ncbi:MAG: aspartyl/asparaginyl beta-hydroxylase domain-containing protein [Flavobacteriales bacterium]|nr:aspartyl/asparaginyl beta-hydroxylase domain-containing protein [Flavobacteriales bacterium]
MIWSEKNIGKLATAFEHLIDRIDRKRVNCGPDFNWTADLEKQFRVVKEEYDRFPKKFDDLNNFQDISPTQKSITTDNKWKVIVLQAFGHRIQENAIHFPQTVKLLESIPGMTSAMISVLAPNKHIPVHRGPFKGVLRILLPIQMPADRANCYIIVDGVRYLWEEGRCFVFDDSLYHEVHNNTDEIRVALFVDFYRPLPFPITVMNRFVYSLLLKTEKVKETLQVLTQKHPTP